LFSSPSSYLGIHLCWERLRVQLAGQERVTIVLPRDDGKIDHLR
jgi:hypothetical protein